MKKPYKKKKYYMYLVCIIVIVAILSVMSILINTYLKSNYVNAFLAEEEVNTPICYTSEDKKYYYALTEKNGCKIIGYQDYTQDIVIVPDKIDGYIVQEIGEAAFAYHEEINELKIPNTVNKLEIAICSGDKNLEKIYIDGDINLIDEFTFNGFNGKLILNTKGKLYEYAEINGMEIEFVKADGEK